MNNNELKKHKKGMLKCTPKSYSLKVSEKGCMSLCGLRRFPVSLYKSEWEVIIGLVKNGSIENFLDMYADELKVKSDKE